MRLLVSIITFSFFSTVHAEEKSICLPDKESIIIGTVDYSRSSLGADQKMTINIKFTKIDSILPIAIGINIHNS